MVGKTLSIFWLCIAIGLIQNPTERSVLLLCWSSNSIKSSFSQCESGVLSRHTNLGCHRCHGWHGCHAMMTTHVFGHRWGTGKQTNLTKKEFVEDDTTRVMLRDMFFLKIHFSLPCGLVEKKVATRHRWRHRIIQIVVQHCIDPNVFFVVISSGRTRRGINGVASAAPRRDRHEPNKNVNMVSRQKKTGLAVYNVCSCCCSLLLLLLPAAAAAVAMLLYATCLAWLFSELGCHLFDGSVLCFWDDQPNVQNE